MMRLHKQLLSIITALLLAACSGSDSNSSGSESPANPTPEPTPPIEDPALEGYNALFIGHSFFRPVAEGMPVHAERLGIEDHTQQVVFAGGANGAPQGLWQNPDKRASIQSILDAGDIELFGMTYHPDHPSLEGYINWVTYALEQNPDTRFFIALPWPTFPATMNVDTYESVMVEGHPQFHEALIDELRSIFPDNVFYCIPYGEGSVELYKLYAQGNLPDVETLITTGDDGGIYRDQLGHPEPILVELSQLVWIQAIFKAELDKYAYEPAYITDLKNLASDVMARHDGAYNDQ